ncbi:hypothetical protein C8J57DRAFT_1242814 [Mycena rebaudengoi]|nr:hypothetical protein C8J57DRAFT_1242814 [Mycena rebaudengoi]
MTAIQLLRDLSRLLFRSLLLLPVAGPNDWPPLAGRGEQGTNVLKIRPLYTLPTAPASLPRFCPSSLTTSTPPNAIPTLVPRLLASRTGSSVRADRKAGAFVGISVKSEPAHRNLSSILAPSRIVYLPVLTCPFEILSEELTLEELKRTRMRTSQKIAKNSKKMCLLQMPIPNDEDQPGDGEGYRLVVDYDGLQVIDTEARKPS